jgi:predicted nuclease with TOPRIM domain
MRVHLQEAAGGDPSGWGSYVVQLIGAGGVGYLLRELVKRAIPSADKRDDMAVGLRTSLVQRLETLERQVVEQDDRLEAMRQENTRLQIRVAQAEEREAWVRNRYHRLMNWMQSEPTLPQPPSYLFETIPDQIARNMAPKPPEPQA